MSNFIVTGGSGFIGGHLVEYLEELGHKVTIFDIKEPEWFKPKAEVIIGDILSTEDLMAATEVSDCIFDCSGVLGSAETFDYFEKTLRVNALGTLRVLDVAKERGIPVVYMSLKNSWKNPYMISKRTGSELCQAYYQYLGTKACAIAGLNAYGPRQHWDPIRKMFPRFIMKILNDETFDIFGDGKQIVDMIYVRDLAKIMYLAYEKEVWGEVFDAGSGRPRTVLSIADDLIKMIGKGKYNHIDMRPGEPDQAIALADPSFIVQKLDYYPETSWEEGCKISLEWYKDLYSRSK